MSYASFTLYMSAKHPTTGIVEFGRFRLADPNKLFFTTISSVPSNEFHRQILPMSASRSSSSTRSSTGSSRRVTVMKAMKRKKPDRLEQYGPVEGMLNEDQAMARLEALDSQLANYKGKVLKMKHKKTNLTSRIGEMHKKMYALVQKRARVALQHCNAVKARREIEAERSASRARG